MCTVRVFNKVTLREEEVQFNVYNMFKNTIYEAYN